MTDMNEADGSQAPINSPLLYAVGGIALLALLSGGTGLALHAVKKRKDHNDYNEEGSDEYDDA